MKKINPDHPGFLMKMFDIDQMVFTIVLAAVLLGVIIYRVLYPY
jgi:hypothetical protein